jgi:hypothetical protein
MRSSNLAVRLVLLAPLALVVHAADDARASVPDGAPLRAGIAFEENRGQVDPATRFLARADGMLLELREQGAILTLRGADDRAPREVTLGFAGGRERVATFGDSLLSGVSHYYRGNDPARWIEGARHYARVRYDDVYPGVDVLFYSKRERVLEYDFVISPGTDPGTIALDVGGADAVSIDAEGNLVITAGGEKLVQKRPYAYQTVDRERREVTADYRIGDDGLVRFDVTGHDPARALVIDPVLTYATYLGGTLGERIGHITVDAGGNVYATGYTFSLDFPVTTGATQSGSSDLFVTRLNAAGNAIIFSTYLGGAGAESDGRVHVDAGGNVYVSGVTGSVDYPTLNAAQPTFAGGTDFVASKLGPTGTLLYSTYIGGGSLELFADGMAVDADGAAHITGQTISQNYPTTPGAWDQTCGTLGTCNGGFDGAVTKLSPSGATIVYSSYVGGSNNDFATDVAVDLSGNAYVVGMTKSADIAMTPGSVQPVYNGDSGDTAFDGGDAFLVKLSPTGGVVYATYIGGNDDDGAFGVAVDSVGNAYVSGGTTSTNFPVTAGALQTTFAGGVGGGSTGLPGQWVGGDGFVVKITPDGSAYDYATYIGGNNNDVLSRVVVHRGTVYASAQTRSPNLPVLTTYQPYFAGGTFDGYAFRLNASGSQLLHATYIGGSNDVPATAAEFASGVAVDRRGDMYVSGGTSATNLLTSPFALQPSFGGASNGLGDGWIVKLATGSSIAGAPDDPYLCYRARSTPRFDALPSVSLADAFESVAFEVSKRGLLCNPAAIGHEGAERADVHLLDYRIRRAGNAAKHVRQTGVVVRSALGTHSYDTVKEAGLLVPSSTSSAGPVDPLVSGLHDVDRYKCYKVKPTKGVPRLDKRTTLEVGDEFGVRAVHQMIRGTRLCLAADEDGRGIKRPTGHLMCHRARRAKGEPAHAVVVGLHANNEIELGNAPGTAVLDTIKEMELCLPAVLGTEPTPTCGDGAVNQPSEQCDGADDLACPFPLCQSDCTCAPAGVCGNDLAEAPGEQCDGNDDSACPGACTTLCMCLGPRTFTINPAVSGANTSLGVAVPLSGTVEFVFTDEPVPGALGFDIPVVQLPGVDLGALFGAICPFLAQDPDLPPGIAGRGILNCTGTDLTGSGFLVSPELGQFQDHCVEGPGGGFCDSAPNPGGGVLHAVSGVFVPDGAVDPTCTAPGNEIDDNPTHGGNCNGASLLSVGNDPYLPGDATLTLNVILDRRASGDPCNPPVTPGAPPVKINFTTGHKQGGVMDLNAAPGTVFAYDLTGTPFNCTSFLLVENPGGGTIVGVFPALDAPLIGTLELDLVSSIRFTGAAP